MGVLSNLKSPPGAVKRKVRVGRGPGSGIGKTCGHGQKGQRARSGHGGKVGFEGGQMPLQRRLPKRGFRNPFTVAVVEVTVRQLERFADGTEVSIELLRQQGLVKGRFDRVKVLGTGELSKRLIVHAHGFTAGATAKIEQVGGRTVVLPVRGYVTDEAKDDTTPATAG